MRRQTKKTELANFSQARNNFRSVTVRSIMSMLSDIQKETTLRSVMSHGTPIVNFNSMKEGQPMMLSGKLLSVENISNTIHCKIIREDEGNKEYSIALDSLQPLSLYEIAFQTVSAEAKKFGDYDDKDMLVKLTLTRGDIRNIISLLDGKEKLDKLKNNLSDILTQQANKRYRRTKAEMERDKALQVKRGGVVTKGRRGRPRKEVMQLDEPIA